jgi:hypothetical protein
VIPSPNVGDANPLYGIAAVASNDVWAVGYSQQNGATPMTLIMHWDGSNWSVVPSPNPNVYNRLFEVRAVSGNDIWAVGNASDCTDPNCPGYTLTEHWDGTSWSVVSSPSPGFQHVLTAIAVATGNDVWAAGSYRPCEGCPYRTLTMRWNGSSWTIVPSPNGGANDNFLSRMSAVRDQVSSETFGLQDIILKEVIPMLFHCIGTAPNGQ